MNRKRLARIQSAADVLVAALEDEQSALDNLPDSFRDGAQGEKMQEAIDAIQSALDSLDEVLQAG